MSHMFKWRTLRLSFTVAALIAGAVLTWAIRPVVTGENLWLNMLLGAALLGLLVHTAFSVFWPRRHFDRSNENDALSPNKSLERSRDG
jgi:hypothetical protein